MKKILFYNISGAIHSNNISEILILFEYFQNMYPCHRRLKKCPCYEVPVIFSCLHNLGTCLMDRKSDSFAFKFAVYCQVF